MPIGRLSQRWWLLFLHFRGVWAESDLSCDLENDPCPQAYQNDDECDSEFGYNLPECFGGDCSDCDTCQQFYLDCGGCLDNGCYWCGADGACTNSPGHIFSKSQCQNEEDFVRDTCSPPENMFSDPLYSAQSWVFDLINVVPVWERGYTGKGVRVRVNDGGVDATHPEFSGRFDFDGSCTDYLPPKSDNFHGTAVASVLGGGANNGECATGVAPEVTISSCFALTNPASVLAEKLDSFDISQNSYGTDACQKRYRRKLQTCPFQANDPTPCSACDFSSSLERQSAQCESAIIDHCTDNYENDAKACVEFLDLFIEDGRCFYNTLSEDEQEAMIAGITQGRDGKGIIYVWASGNTYQAGEDTDFQGYLNTRFTIAVGGVGKDGLHASYSTPGAALFVTAPGGDLESYSNHIVADVGSGCSSVGFGTSFACPVVSGVIALMLESNPELSWRDVQGILATTSRMVVDELDNDTRYTNAAGITHSHFYGFGVIDANAVVNAAKDWKLFGPEEMMVGESRLLNVLIPDNSKSTTLSSITLVPKTDDFIAESVVVYLDIQHFSRGDLDVVLTSPEGTVSKLHPGNRPENTQLEDDEQWKLLTVRSWGEFARGDWSIAITDISQGNVDACANHPFLVEVESQSGPVTLDCLDAVAKFYCRDGELSDASPEGFLAATTDKGRTAAEACCACGGGLSTNDFVDLIVKWRIVVYGRSYNAQPTISPKPTMNPTQSPGQVIPPASSGATPTKSSWSAYLSKNSSLLSCLLLSLWALR